MKNGRRICLILFAAIAVVGMYVLFGQPAFATTCDPNYVSQSGSTFTVSPTGVDDTANIQCAFDAAVAAGPGSTVQLEAGTFYLSRDIVVVNFDGSFRGAGKGRTIVQNLDDVPFPLHGDPYPYHDYPGLLLFYQDATGIPSTLNFSDMTIRVRGKSEPWSAHGFGPWDCMTAIEVWGKVTQVEDFEESYVDASFERMEFEGEAGEFNCEGLGVNVESGVWFGGEQIVKIKRRSTYVKYVKPLSGTLSVTDCSFENTAYGILTFMLVDSTVSVERNTFDNVGQPFWLVDPSNTNVEFSRNRATNTRWFGVRVNQALQSVRGWDFGPFGELPEPSSLLISHNTIHAVHIADGVGIEDYAPLVGENGRLHTVISNNRIILDNTWYGGIWGYSAQDVVVTNNVIEGTGLAGIYTGVDWEPVSGWTILGNNVQNVDADVAPIWLGPGTSNCTVVGGSSESNVWDQGTDNILVGVNNMQGNPPGPEIKEALEKKLEIIKSLR